MLHTREQLEHQEEEILAPYAVKSVHSFGRKYRDHGHLYRTGFQRDRARIIHSTAFRRLGGKTQVFLNGMGDHYRTRLTHTLEVASIARTLARVLALNEDLTEAIALAHDLGHTPFGHAGEDTLSRLMAEYGGFDHNAQSLRVVSLLEEKYPQFPGLNLSFEVLEGLRKHEKILDFPDGTHYLSPSLESQVADLADEITYYSHDLEDGIQAKLLDFDKLETLAVWSQARQATEDDCPGVKVWDRSSLIIRTLVNRAVDDVVTTSRNAIQQAHIQSLDEVRNHPKRLITFSASLKEEHQILRNFLFKYLYHHPVVLDANSRGCVILESFFKKLETSPQLLGQKALRRLKREGLHRTVADYLSGMTDGYCLEQYAKIDVPKIKSFFGFGFE